MSAGGGRGNPVVGVIPASDGRCRRRGEPRLQRPPGVARHHRRRCADAWGVGGGSRVGVKAAGGYGWQEGGGMRHVKACLCGCGRSFGRSGDLQMTEVE